MSLLKGNTEAEAKRAVEMLHVFANTKCNKIIKVLLENGTLSVLPIVEKAGLLQPETSYYLRLMLGHGIVIKKRVGKKSMYTLNTARLEKVLAAVDKLLDEK